MILGGTAWPVFTMKFRGRMTDMMAVRKFHLLLGTMAKLAKSCVLRLTADKLYFIVTETMQPKSTMSMCPSPSVWCEMQRDHFFYEYNMEGKHFRVKRYVASNVNEGFFFNSYTGVTPENPEIFLELEPDRLAKTLVSLRSSNSPRSLKIKLTRKHFVPCLSFEIDLSTASGSLGDGSIAAASSRMCVHDVPVNIIPRRLWGEYKEPEMHAFDVSLYLPGKLHH